jgi:hypothetical protein
MRDADRTRLIKLLGMTGSSHDGEIAVAARKANELLRTLRLSWADVIGGTVVHVHEQPKARAQASMGWHEKALACLMHGTVVGRERAFLQSLCDRRWRTLTEKQQKWLDDIHFRLFGEAA